MSTRKANIRNRSHLNGEGVKNTTHQSTHYQSAELKQILPKLRPFQREAYEFATQGIVSQRLSGQAGQFEYDVNLLGKGRILLCDEMGLGKTITSLAIMAHYRQEWPLLILCPASLRHTWPAEIEKFMPSIPPSSIYVCSGFHDVAFRNRTDIQVVVVTYSLLQDRSAVSKLLLGNEIDFKCIICDESHNLKSKQSQRSKIALPILRRANRLLLLSGTPALARPAELWLQLHALAPDLFGSWTTFTKRYCDAKRKFGHWDFTGLSNAEELHSKLKQVMVRRLKCDVLHELPPKQRTIVPLRITDKAHIKENKQIIQDLNETRLSIAELVGDDQAVASFEAKQLFNQAYQASGIAKASAVAEYMVDWISGAGTQKVLVFAHHKAVMDILEMALSKHLKGVGHIRIDGGVPSNERANLVRKLQTSPQVRVALLSMTAAGVGLTLTAASSCMFAELHYTPGVLAQAEDRCHRIGQRNAVNIMYFVCKDESISTDTGIWKMLGRKVSNLERIIDGGSGREKAALAANEAQVDCLEDSERRSGQEELSNFFAETASLDGNGKTPPKEPVKGSIMSFFNKQKHENITAANYRNNDKSATSQKSVSSTTVVQTNSTIEWECTACTFVNSKKTSAHLSCEMCNTRFVPKPSIPEENEAAPVTPFPTSDQKARTPTAPQSTWPYLDKSKITSPKPLKALTSTPQGIAIAEREVVVIDEDTKTKENQTEGIRGSEVVVIDSDDDGDHKDTWRNARKVKSFSAVARTKAQTVLRKSELPEILLFSVSKNTSRVSIHYKKDSIPSLVNFDVQEVLAEETVDALSEAHVARTSVQATSVQIAFNSAAVSTTVYQLDPDKVSSKNERKQCCEELKEFVSSFLALREVEKRAIKESGKAFSSKGLRQSAMQIMTGVLRTTSVSTERYSGGARECAKANLDTGNASASDLAVLKGDNCSWCASVLSVASKTAKSIYCSQACAEEGRLRRGGMYASSRIREQLFALEGGVCQDCGRDAHALFRNIKALHPSQRLNKLQNVNFELPKGNEAYKRLLQDPKEGDFWQADHIRAVSEGGGGCGLDNFRTLCVPCHSTQTKSQNSRRKLNGGMTVSDSETNDDGKRKQTDIRLLFASTTATLGDRNKRHKKL